MERCRPKPVMASPGQIKAMTGRASRSLPKDPWDLRPTTQRCHFSARDRKVERVSEARERSLRGALARL